jgi:hypothetical protein
MTTIAEAERRAAIAVQMREEGATYDQIAAALGLRSRGHVNYYLNLEKRREKQRQFYVEHIQGRRDYQAEYRECSRAGFSCQGDRTAFKPETPRQARLWAKLLGVSV